MVTRSGNDVLQTAPGIGPSLAADLHDLGVHTLPALARRDPERLYASLCDKRGARMDPCVLYAFRCAVYFARTPRPRPELLQWWNWKDRRLARGSRSTTARARSGERSQIKRAAR